MAEYNTKAEGHRGEAARLELMAEDLLKPAARRKEIAAELRERAAAHWAKAAEAEGTQDGFANVTPLDAAVDEPEEVDA